MNVTVSDLENQTDRAIAVAQKAVAAVAARTDALCTLADRHATLGPAQANFARQCLEAAGVPLTLTVREACGMKREGVDEP